jgi:fumarate hydratase class II
MMLPVAAHNLLESINLLATSSNNFSEQCIVGLTATENGPLMVERGLMLGTALAPAVGYDKAAAIAKKAAETGSTIREIAQAETSLSSSELDRILNPEEMTEPGLGSGVGGG